MCKSFRHFWTSIAVGSEGEYGETMLGATGVGVGTLFWFAIGVVSALTFLAPSELAIALKTKAFL